MLDDRLTDEVPADVVESLSGHAPDGPLESLLFELTAARTFREPDDVDLRDRKKALGVLVEEEQADIDRERRFLRTGHNAKLSPEDFQRHLVCRLGEVASDPGEEFDDEIAGEV